MKSFEQRIQEELSKAKNQARMLEFLAERYTFETYTAEDASIVLAAKFPKVDRDEQGEANLIFGFHHSQVENALAIEAGEV